MRTRWLRFQGKILHGYSRLVINTARHHIEGWEHAEAAQASDRPILWSLWHGQMMAFVCFGARNLDASQFAVIIVGDDRGDTLGHWGQNLGGRTFKVDMQGNPFAAGRAVLRVVRAMREGYHTVLAPDGPDGPAFVPKSGVAFLARKAEAALMPIGVWTRHAVQLPRWDRYLVPLPFARFHVALGAPIYVQRDQDQDVLLDTISRALHEVRTRAQILAGVRPWR